jgi:hypothetical protein
MSTMVSKFLTVLCPDWTIHLLDLTSDGARNMTGRVAGVVTRLNVAMHNDYSLIRIWCGTHQLDLVMEDIMNNVWIYNSFNMTAESDRGNANYVPSCRQSLAFDGEGHQLV